jgi:hypothetical protein
MRGGGGGIGKPIRSLQHPVTLVGKVKETRGHMTTLLNIIMFKNFTAAMKGRGSAWSAVNVERASVSTTLQLLLSLRSIAFMAEMLPVIFPAVNHKCWGYPIADMRIRRELLVITGRCFGVFCALSWSEGQSEFPLGKPAEEIVGN